MMLSERFLISDGVLLPVSFASTQAAWFNGIKPDATGFTPAPATIVAVNKPGGIVDAFYFYFYSYDHAIVSERCLSRS